jgi:hypothetical protein
MHSFSLNPDKKKQEEWDIIQLIARNNNFQKHLLQKLKRQTQTESQLHTTKREKTQDMGHIHIP